MKLGSTPLGSNHVCGDKNLTTQNCLLCSNSFSEELNDGANQLRCAMHEWATVEDNRVCEEFQ